MEDDTIDGELVPKVTLKGTQIVTNSKDVASYFGKRHDHVTRDIRKLLADAPEVASNFGANEISDLTGTSVGHYDMTRDGFTLLAMGFTGPKALRFKIAYIAQFNAMEAELKKPMYPALPNFSDPAVAARAWAEQFERAAVSAKALQAASAQIEQHLTHMTVDEFRAFRHVKNCQGSNRSRMKIPWQVPCSCIATTMKFDI